VGPEAEETCPADSPGHVEEEKATRRHAICASKQSRKHSQYRDKAAKKHDSVPIPKKQISTDQQSVFIEMYVSPVFAKKRRPEAAPDRVSDPISDDRTCRGRCYNDSDIDLIGGCGQKGGCNKDRLSGKGHASAF
jgi:hypothetical protein